jgi:hypothetical protein
VASEYRVSADGSGISFIQATSDAITEYNAEIDAEIKEAMHAGGKAARTHLRSNSPKDTGAYSRSWACDYEDREGHHEVAVKSRDRWQLTHLLEDGHESRNQYGGPFGTVPPASPKHHIETAAEHGKQVIAQKLGVSL